MKEKKIIILLSIFLFCISCGLNKGDPNTLEIRKAQNQEIFFKCLSNIPKGPESTVTNDWNEVINSCRSYADGLYWPY